MINSENDVIVVSVTENGKNVVKHYRNKLKESISNIDSRDIVLTNIEVLYLEDGLLHVVGDVNKFKTVGIFHDEVTEGATEEKLNKLGIDIDYNIEIGNLHREDFIKALSLKQGLENLFLNKKHEGKSFTKYFPKPYKQLWLTPDFKVKRTYIFSNFTYID